MTARAGNKAAELATVLQAAGLGGRVRVGIPLPPDAAALGTSRSSKKNPPLVTSPPGAEENNLEVLLRPSGAKAGRLVEIEGGPSSGRTALAYRLAAQAAHGGALVGWVDLPDALDPRSLRRTGMDLDGLLWVRPPRVPAALRAAELLLRTGFGLVVIDLESAGPRALERTSTASWSRLLRAAQKARATAVLLGSARASGAFASLGLHTERRRARFEMGLFEGLEAAATVIRNRHGPSGTDYALSVSHRPVAN